MRQTVVYLRGGMGNQFFQWLYALWLAEQGYSPVLDCSFLKQRSGNQAVGHLELHQIFSDLCMPVRSGSSWLHRLEPLWVRLGSLLGVVSVEVLGKKDAVALRKYQYGYFQSSRYYVDSVERLVMSVKRPEVFARAGGRLPMSLRTTPYVALHVRGGDYMNHGYNSTQIGALTGRYYSEAFDFLKKKGLPIVVVSDDEAWAQRVLRDVLSQGCKISFLSELAQDASDPLVAVAVMANAEALATANSSFSALCAYVNPDGEIYCPSPWFKGDRLRGVSPARKAWRGISSWFA